MSERNGILKRQLINKVCLWKCSAIYCHYSIVLLSFDDEMCKDYTWKNMEIPVGAPIAKNINA